MRHVLAAVLALSLTAALPAQPLAERVPKAALVYVGWRGADELEGYEGSHLQGVVQSTNLVQQLTTALPAWLEAQAGRRGDRGGREFAAVVREMGPVVWSRPAAFYVGAMEFPEAAPPRPTFGLLIEAGPHADLTRRWMQKWVDMTQGRPGGSLQLVDNDGVLGVRMGDTAGEITDRAGFKEARGRLTVEPSFIAYVDLESLYDEIDLMVNENVPAQGLERWQNLSDALGLHHLQQFLYAGGIAGSDWKTQAHIRVDDPANTLLRFLTGPPLTPTDLQPVPRTATWFLAQRADLAALMDTVRNAARAAGPEAANGMDRGLAEAKAQLGVDLEDEILRQLGDAWLVYTDPAVAGPTGLGAVAVNRLRDAAKVEAALTTLDGKFNALSEAKGQPQRFTTLDLNGITVHTLTTPIVSPSWAVVDGRLYLGAFPQAIATANLYARQADASILQNETFQKVTARLERPTYTGIMFADLPRTAPTVYGLYTMALQSLAAQAGGGPPLALPPLTAFQPHLAPAAQVGWTDAAGFNSESVSPFPGSTFLSHQALVNAPGLMGPMLARLARPAMTRSAQGEQSMQNLKQIGLAIHMWAADHDDALPPDFAAVTPKHGPLPIFIHPDADVVVPNAEGMAPEAIRAWLAANASYVYVRPAETLREIERPGESILAFEKPAFAAGGTLAVLFVDGHVERRPLDAAREAIETQTGKTLDELLAP